MDCVVWDPRRRNLTKLRKQPGHSRRYDAIGRVENVKNNATGQTYAGSATYSAANQLTGFSYLNGISASFGYSADRLQLASVAYTQSSTNLLSLSYNYDQDSGSGVKNNGQIAGITDNVESGRSATYTYDARKRLATAGTSGSTGYPQWGLSWTYDDYGNRTAQSVTAGSGPSNSVTVSTSTNRITAMGGYTLYYDANGNLTQDDLYKYKYDAENRLVEVKNLSDTLIATYAFDGNSLRTIKVVGADRTWYLYRGTEVIAEFEDAASATYNPGTNPGGAGSDTGTLLLYQHGDHLTGRLTTDQQGNVSNQQGHYPYGESWYASGTADPSVERKFTSYQKDPEVSSGRLNFAVFREQSARVARFLSPDPIHGSTVQALNRYSYTSNDPLNRVDPKGLEGGTSTIGGVGDIWVQVQNGNFVWADLTGIVGGSGGDMLALCPITPFLPGKTEPCDLIGDRIGGDPCGWGSPLTPPFLPNTAHPLCGGDMGQSGMCWAKLTYRDAVVEGLPSGITHSSWCVQDGSLLPPTRISAGPQPPCPGPGCASFLNVWEIPWGGCDGATWATFYGCDKVDLLKQAARAWPNNTMQYVPWGPNSNTAARMLGEQAGLFTSMPPGAIGW